MENDAEKSDFLSAVLKRIVIIVPYAWLTIFFLVPFLIVFKISFSTPETAIPPYLPTFTWAEGLTGWIEGISSFTFSNYLWIAEDPLYRNAYIQSVWISFTATLITLLVGYPLAYGMARAPQTLRPILVMLVILPFWTSFLIRVYAWIGILKPEGLLNQFLMATGITSEPLIIIGTNTAIYIGIVYSYLPFMVLPIYATLEKMDGSLIEAARDLGCTAIGAFWKVTMPLSVPGIIAGFMLVFIPAVGEFVIPDLLGGSKTLMIGKTLWTEFFANRDWPVSSAVAVVLLLILVVPIAWFQNYQAKSIEKGR